jgi:hypothetical protein
MDKQTDMFTIIEHKSWDDCGVVLKVRSSDDKIMIVVSACGGPDDTYSADTMKNGKELYDLFVNWISNGESFDFAQIKHSDAYRQFDGENWLTLTEYENLLVTIGYL